MNNEAVEKVRASIEQLPEQYEQAWKESTEVKFPSEYKDVEKVIVCGMGGSGLPTHFITSVFAAKVPIILINGYDIPYWADKKTLVLLSSYSGETEETLSCGELAKKNNCRITGIASGGKLARWLRENNYPSYIFNPIYNPSGKPRLGIGYGIFGQLGLLGTLGLIQPIGGTLGNVVPREIKRMGSSFSLINKQARKLVPKLKGEGVMIFAADHLVGNAHIFANQLNETAKTFATWFSLPEANHHLLEGLKYPRENLVSIFLVSSSYSKMMQKRFELTAQVVKENKFETYEYRPKQGNLLGEALEVLLTTSIISLELGITYKENPLEIPWVDWFKKQLAK